QAKSALGVPQTGVVDFPKLADKFCELLREKGVELQFRQAVKDIHTSETSLLIQTQSQSFDVDFAVNCAGLYSDKIALMAGAKPEHRIIPFRGEYFMLKEAAAKRINGLVYP